MSRAGDKTEGRDERGRFASGNRGGPGGARRRALDLRKAAEEAISPEHVQGIVRRVARMALEGNLSAARLVLDRVCGKPPELREEAAPLPFELPRLQTIVDCNTAIERLVAAMCAGAIEQREADTLLKAIQVRIRVIESSEIEERLAQLERALKQADLHGGR